MAPFCATSRITSQDCGPFLRNQQIHRLPDRPAAFASASADGGAKRKVRRKRPRADFDLIRTLTGNFAVMHKSRRFADLDEQSCDKDE